MFQHNIERGEKKMRVACVRVRGIVSMLVLAMCAWTLIGVGGCAQAEKTRYMRHLTTVIEPSAEAPEEAILTFDIDRKRLRDTLAHVEN